MPLCKVTRQIIAGVSASDTLLFPACERTDKPFKSFGASNRSLDTGGINDFMHHDLRHTFAANMAKLDVRFEVSEKLLTHVSVSFGGNVGVYQRRKFKDEMCEAVRKRKRHC